MENIMLTLIVDSMMALLLIVTIWYCLRLNKRIQALQDARGELAVIIREFDESTQRATQSIAEIHKASQRLSENMQHKIDKANFLADDLQFLIERSAKIADKVEATTGTVRGGSAPRSAAADIPRSRPAAQTGTQRAEMSSATSPQAETSPQSARSAAGLRMRSRAEQDLMDALKSNE